MKKSLIALGSAAAGVVAGGALVKKVWREKCGEQYAEFIAARNERDILYTWLLLRQRGVSPARFFDAHGYGRVAVLGMGPVGRLAIDALGDRAAYGIATGNLAAVHERLTVYRLGEDELPEADCILICETEHIRETAELLRRTYSGKIVTLGEMLQDLLEEAEIEPRDGAIAGWPPEELYMT